MGSSKSKSKKAQSSSGPASETTAKVELRASVAEDVAAHVRSLSETRDQTLSEVVEGLIRTAISRRASLEKDRMKNRAPKEPKPKKSKKAKPASEAVAAEETQP